MIKNFLVKKGDQLSFTITFTSTTDVTSMQFGVKKYYTDDTYTILKSLGNGITKINNRKYQIVLSSSDTAALDIFNYVYDLRLSISALNRTPLSGKLMIKDTVFRG